MFTIKATTSKGSQYFKAYGRYGNQIFTSKRSEAKEFNTDEDARFNMQGLLTTKVPGTYTVCEDAILNP